MRIRTELFAAALTCFLLLSARASREDPPYRSTRQEFIAFQMSHPADVFAPTVGPKVKDCLRAYEARERLPSGARYGDSVRGYSLADKRLREIRADMRRLGCPLKMDVLREPKANNPLLHQGRTIPLWVFLCPDGGVVRVKPLGDPTSGYRPQPHASKGLRYPFDARFEGFANEIVKIDNRGVAIPKSRAELGARQFVHGWADDGHSDVLP